MKYGIPLIKNLKYQIINNYPDKLLQLFVHISSRCSRNASHGGGVKKQMNDFPNAGSVWNAMINPFVRHSIKGILLYHGKINQGPL